MGATCGRPVLAQIAGNNNESQATYWTAPMVGSWIDLLGLSTYKREFLDNGVDGPTLLELRKDQFERCLGLTNPLHEMSLRYGLHDLKTKMIDYTKWEWSCTGVLQWLSLRGLEQLVQRFRKAAVHGGVLFNMKKSEFASRLFVGEQGESELVLESLWHAIERAKKTGYFQQHDNFLDWGPLEVRQWLESIHLGHLDELFREHAVNGTLLPYLDQATLRRVMKLTEIQSIVIHKAIRKLLRSSKSRSKSNKENRQRAIQRAQTQPAPPPVYKSTPSSFDSGEENCHHHHARSDSVHSVRSVNLNELALSDRTNL